MDSPDGTLDLVAGRNPGTDTFEVTGRAVGPAGAADLGSTDGTMVLTVDCARPSRFTALRFQPGSRAATVVLDALTGGAGAEVTTRIEQIGEGPRLVWSGPRSEPVNAFRRGAHRPSAEIALHHLQRMALLRSEVDAAMPGPAVRSAGLLEYAYLGFDVPVALTPAPAPLEAVEAGLEHLEHAVGSADPSRHLGAFDHETLGQFVRLLHVISGELYRVGDPTELRARGAARRLVEVAGREVLGREALGRESETAGATGRPSDPLHDAAPRTPPSTRGTTSGPGNQWGVASALGRSAAGAERRDDQDRASTLWRACARAWVVAGDSDRARLADDYAGQAASQAASQAANQVASQAAGQSGGRVGDPSGTAPIPEPFLIDRLSDGIPGDLRSQPDR